MVGALRVAGLVFALTAPAAAQSDYPNRPIRIVVSVAAGGGVDLSARIIASHLQQLWGQTVTVENRTGGSGNIAARPCGAQRRTATRCWRHRPTP
jgi:tripartite-type tricarboxylate transporter receptor subunit TctC